MPIRHYAVTPVLLPAESRIATAYAQTDLADAYSIELPTGTSTDPEVLARFVFSQMPAWSRGLMKLRDALVAGFGLKTSKHLTSVGPEESRVGFFKIYSTDQAEIVLGEDDKHLDFRLSVSYSNTPSPLGKQRVIVSTVVRCHNLLGRTYIFLIAPFHRLIIQSCLSHAALSGWPQAVEA